MKAWCADHRVTQEKEAGLALLGHDGITTTMPRRTEFVIAGSSKRSPRSGAGR